MSFETMAGNNDMYYQHAISKPFSNASPWSFSNVSSITVPHQNNEATVTIMNQVYLGYNIIRGLSLNVGGYYASAPGFRVSTALKFSKVFKDCFILIQPRFDFFKKKSYETFAIFEYMPKLSQSTSLYTRVQLLSNYGNSGHNKSYQYFRAGVSLKKIEFGLGVNLDEYGKSDILRKNFGLFLRKGLSL